MPHITRRAFFSLFGGAAALFVYGKFVEPGWLRAISKEIHLDKIPAGRSIRILQLSDMHYPLIPVEFILKAFRTGLSYKPDIIFLTGDFVDKKITDRKKLKEALSSITAHRVPVYAILGNHDGGHWAETYQGYRDTGTMHNFVNSCGIRCLLNETAQLNINGCHVEIIGTGDLWAGDFDPGKVPGYLIDNNIRIVLAHNPDCKDYLKDKPWDLMLCGHTHGGQVKFPVFGAPFAPVKDTGFTEGLHSWDGRWLYINTGLASNLGFRLNCRPEVTIIDLKAPA